MPIFSSVQCGLETCSTSPAWITPRFEPRTALKGLFGAGRGSLFFGDPIFPVLCGNFPSSTTSVCGNGPILAPSERQLQSETVGDGRAEKTHAMANKRR